VKASRGVWRGAVGRRRRSSAPLGAPGPADASASSDAQADARAFPAVAPVTRARRRPLSSLWLAAIIVAVFGTAVALGSETHHRPKLLSRPTLTGIVEAGGTARAHSGRWSGASRLFSAWELCNTAGAQCHRVTAFKKVPRPSRVVKPYSVGQSALGHRIRVLVKATNRWGTTRATSLPSHVIVKPAPGQPATTGAGGGIGGSGVAISSGPCVGSELCVGLPASGTGGQGGGSSGSGVFDLGFSSGDSYPGFLSAIATPGGGFPSVKARVDASGYGVWRVLSEDGYNDASTTQIEPSSYTASDGKSVRAWNFTALDKVLSEGPVGAPRELEENIPDALWTGDGGFQSTPAPGAVADQTYGDSATFYANVVRYFRTGIVASDSGITTYTANTLTDPSQNFIGDVGDCLTATVIDANGFPDWVTGTVASVSDNDQITLATNWSDAESYDVADGAAALITNTTPAPGAAYNLASCTPPIQLDTPRYAVPWPTPPSVGNVQYWEIGNEYDLSNYNQGRIAPALPPPSPITLTGVYVAGGTLNAGSSYSYEIASANAQGGLSLPSSAASITLPAGDNAVNISWNATSDDDLTPFAYWIYGRSSGNHQAIVSVGENAPLSWTDTGTITPSGSPSGSDQTADDTIFTPGVYVQMWNAIAPAMKAVDSTIELTGPTVSNPHSVAGTPWVNPSCVTTGPPGGGAHCTNGASGWLSSTDYVPELLSYGSPTPDVVTIHAYGGLDDSDANYFSNLASQVKSYRNTDQTAVDAAHVPVWIDETNVNADNAGAQSSATNLRAMTQLGAAWLADSTIVWAQADPLVRQLFQFEADGANDANFALFGTTSERGNGSCTPQPSCQAITSGQPDLEYWATEAIDSWMTAGTTIPYANTPAGFNALAVQTSPNTIVLLLVNTQAGSGNGNGAPGTAQIQIDNTSVTDTKEITINGSTNLATGPAVRDLGAQSSVTINAAGYEVDLLKFTTTGS
jgi:hypothetical protein